MIEEEKIELLRRRSERPCAVTIEDLREIFPIDEMSADQLALVVLELEQAGVVIEIDEALMGSSRRRMPTSPDTAVINLPGAHGGARDVVATRVSASDVRAGAFSPTEPVERATPAHKGAGIFVAAAALLIAAGAIAAFLLTR